MKVVAVLALGTHAPREEQAEVSSRDAVRLGVSAVLCNVAPALRVRLRESLVLVVAARPLVVPDVEGGARLRGWLRRQEGRVDLRPGGALLAADYLLDFLLGRLSDFCGGVGGDERAIVGVLLGVGRELERRRLDLGLF